MKIYNKPATGKLFDRFDNQLKKMLSEDLKAFIVKSKFTNSNIQAAVQPLPAA